MRALKRVLLFLVLAVAVVYAGDYAVLRFRSQASAFGTVVVQPYYAIGLKNKKTEFDFNVPPENVTCSHSMFPHMGVNPCWYVEQHKQLRIDE